MKQITRNRNKQTPANDLRLLPLGMAALVCFLIAVSSGSAFWYFFGSKSPFRKSKTAVIAVLPESAPTSETTFNNGESANNAPSLSPQPETTQPNQPPNAGETQLVPESEQPKTILAPAGELNIEGGEIVLGGGDTKLPLRREVVTSFAIAETEVTNAQFKEFVDATNAKIKLPIDKDDEPVTGISWEDANAYCAWLANKLGAKVRLPTEAEWEYAARGKENRKYPWGAEWRDDAADCKENKGKVRPVKSHPTGKSGFGAYDMVGNVWEWTNDPKRDARGKIEKSLSDDSIYQNKTLYLVKGGAAIEARANNFVQARAGIPQNFSSPDIGFRYVVLRSNERENNFKSSN